MYSFFMHVLLQVLFLWNRFIFYFFLIKRPFVAVFQVFAFLFRKKQPILYKLVVIFLSLTWSPLIHVSMSTFFILLERETWRARGGKGKQGKDTHFSWTFFYIFLSLFSTGISFRGWEGKGNAIGFEARQPPRPFSFSLPPTTILATPPVIPVFVLPSLLHFLLALLRSSLCVLFPNSFSSSLPL